MAALNMNEGAAAAIDDSSNDNNNNSPTSPPRLVNIAIDSSLDNNDNNANGLSTPTKSLQGIKEESNNDNNETENAVECINQLSFSSPTIKMTTSSLCNNTIGSTSSSTTNSNNKPPTADDNNTTSTPSNCNNDVKDMISDTNNYVVNSACSTKLPPSFDSTILQNEQSSSKLDVTITVLSLHGIISKHVDKKSSNPLSGGSGTNSGSGGSKKKKKGSSKKNSGGASNESKEENATIVASFTQQIGGTSDKVFLTHVPSLPVSLNSGTTSNDSMEQSTAENGGKKKKKKKEEELQSLNVNWASSESLGDDVRSAPYALSTINFTKEFIHENNKSPITKSIATTNNGVNGTMNNSSNISVDASTNSKQSKKSSSTVKSSSTGVKSTTNTNSKANRAENKQHYIPQTIPVNLSISRSGKMILLGKVNLVVNGEENGESSLSVPIVSSIKDNTKKLKPIKKLKLRKNKSNGTSNGSYGSEVQSNKGSEAENKGMVKMKGDTYSFGLENNAMLRVLVNVNNPNKNEKDTVNDKDDDVDFDATVQGSIEDCNEDEDGESMLMEGLSIEQVSSNDSLSLEEHDYYASYIPVSNELRTLRTQIQQLDNTNKVLQMELATANNTISNECNMVAALHDENKLLRDELEEVHVELEELLMSRSTTNTNTNKEIELEDENEELKCQIEQLRMRLDTMPVLQEEVETLRTELAIARDTSQGSSDSSSSSPTTTTTADAIAAALRIENTKLRTELIRAQSNATTLLGELNTSKSESEMLPFYERRVNELLEELKKRDLEVSCLKDELSEANARAKSSLVEGLLWDDDDDNEEDVEEDNTAAGGGGGGANRLSLAARKLAAAAESHVLAKHGLKARDEGSSESSSAIDDQEKLQVQVQDEEGKKLLAEIDRIYAADKTEGISSALDGDTESTSTPSTEESIDKAAKGSSGDDTSSVADTEATTPERDTTEAVDSPLMRDWGSPVNQAAPSSVSSSEDATNDDDDTKRGSRGLGLRGLGSRLKAAEEKMRERQQLFREQQQKVLAEQQRLAELEKQNAEPGLSDVLIARMASSRKTSDDKDEDAEQENAKEDSAAQDEGPQDIKQEEATLSSAAGDDDSSMDTAAKAESMTQVSNTLKEIETMSNEVTRRESQQGLLLENMDSLEQEFGLRTMASHDELVPSAPPTSGDPKDLEGSVSKEKKSKGILSRIKKVGRKNKKSKEEGIEEKDAIEEVDSQTQPGGSTSTEDLNTTQDLSDSEGDNDSYKEFIQIISTDELDRKESTGSAENHIGTVVA